jgi:hypothetical protein
MTYSDIDLLCSLNKDGSFEQEFQRLKLSQSERTFMPRVSPAWAIPTVALAFCRR